MSFNSTPYKPRPPPGQLGSTPFRSSSANRFRSSLVPTSRPSPTRPSNSPTKVTKMPTGARDLFRTSTPRTQRTAEFAPDLPAEVTRPRASVRKFAPRKSVSSGMSNTASTEPFKMRIPSPDPDLTGQALAKEVPDDPNRTGSIYADQFLAHKCPPHFDEIQRRQFFCILDLRRLKYAADEIFAKKDWKLNILNFAKEYEKSRGLIMLRYGLYEFKNIKPSNEVLKKWRAAHGLPHEPEENASSSPQHRRTPGPAGPTKRKAEEQLTPKDNALMASGANQNKRRNLAQETDDRVLTGAAPLKKSKRKAEETEEIDENKPSKQQKASPSAATSLFESILNKTRNGGASPLRQTSQASPLSGVSKPKDAQDTKPVAKDNPFNPTGTGSLFGSTKKGNFGTSGSVLSGHKLGSTPKTNTGNIFSYLSESSSDSSGNENENDNGHEIGSEPEQDSDEHDIEVVASTNTSTPPVQNGASLPATEASSSSTNIFGSLSKPADQTAKGGLFGRVQMGTNGQPVRASPDPGDKQECPASQTLSATERQAKTPAKVMGDYTFNPATTPISFGQPAHSSSKPFATENAESSVKPTAFEPKKPLSIFGASIQAVPAPKSITPGLFGLSDSTKPKSSEAQVSIFAPQKPDSASASIFGASPTVFTAQPLSGTDSQTDGAPSAAKKQAISIFDKSTTTSHTSETKAPDSSPDDKAASSAAPTKPQVPNIFEKSFIEKNAAQAKALPESPKPSFDLFSRNSNPLFGAPKDAKPASKDTEADSKDTKVGSDVPAAKSQPPNIFDKSFIASNAAQAKTLSESVKPSPGLFSRDSNPLFGAAKANGATSTDATSIFGQSESRVSTNAAPQTPSDDNKANKGPALELKAPAPNSSAVSIFGTQGPSLSMPSSFGDKKLAEPAKPAPTIFAGAPATNSPMFSFGSQPSGGAGNQSSSTIFSAGPTAGASISFGASTLSTNGAGPKKTGFQFGSSTPGASSASFTFGQSTSSGSDFTFTAGTNKQSIKNPFAPSQPSSQLPPPVFGGNSSTVTPSSSFNVSFGQQPSLTPKAAPPSRGGGLFGGSTNTNGAPMFSFTQASPSQNSSDIKFPKPPTAGSFGHLQASEGSTFGNSPFPAPSSIGTTPVNGTPEPQSPREDGEEAPQEQIKLTEGGPGEEDETMLHEVRAKAIKYVPVQKEDEDAPKSPWSTQGVGPLRVLKNKSTGTVRVLLRAEPRGHIAMNKTILSDVKYTAREKTVNFTAASDDGSSLETWVIQVKKPELAKELALVLEANKMANRR